MKRAKGVPTGIVVPMPPGLVDAIEKYVSLGSDLLRIAKDLRDHCNRAADELERDASALRRRSGRKRR